jgi:hypothetical protein
VAARRGATPLEVLALAQQAFAVLRHTLDLLANRASVPAGRITWSSDQSVGGETSGRQPVHRTGPARTRSTGRETRCAPARAGGSPHDGPGHSGTACDNVHLRGPMPLSGSPPARGSPTGAGGTNDPSTSTPGPLADVRKPQLLVELSRVDTAASSPPPQASRRRPRRPRRPRRHAPHVAISPTTRALHIRPTAPGTARRPTAFVTGTTPSARLPAAPRRRPRAGEHRWG